MFLLALSLTVPIRASEQVLQTFKCSTAALCEQSMRELTKQLLASSARHQLIKSVTERPADWLSPLLLRLSDDPDSNVQQLALLFLQEMPGLSDRYWQQIEVKLNRDPLQWIEVALRMRHPAIVPAVLQLILQHKLDARLLFLKWPESQQQVRVFLQSELERLSVAEHPMSCNSAENFQHTMCYILSQMFRSLPLEHRIQIWQVWSGRLADSKLPEDFVLLLLTLTNKDFFRQLPPGVARQTETQLIRLKANNPNLRYNARHSLIDLGRPSAAIEVTENLKEFLATKSRSDSNYLNPMFVVAKFAPLIQPKAFSNFQKPEASDPDYAEWVILLGMTRQSGAEADILRAWQKQHAPVENAAALVSAAYYSASLLQQLQAQAKRHWYPPIRALAESLLNHTAVSLGMTEDERSERSKMLRVREKLQMSACHDLREPPASPEQKKWYNQEQLESLTFRFPDISVDGFSVANIVAAWRATTTGTEFLPLLAQWGVDQSLARQEATAQPSENKAFHFEPRAALQLENGWISVADRGEWSGELRYVNKTNSIQIAKGNFQDVFLVGTDVVVVKASAHSHDGRIYKLRQNDKEQWALELWREIPATAEAVWQLADGRLVLQSSAGTFLLSPTGTLQMAECLSIEK
ncbi:hypothetical protein ATY27_16445 [Rheinheimera sp. F8]|nr:hypothetical protein ATY27_16445 [Rheinheimera sp. F8]